MKRIISLAVAMALAGMMGVAYADNVSQDQARRAAALYYGQNAEGNRNIKVDDLHLAHRFANPRQQDVTAVYMFNVNGGGWIALSGTTLVDPLIAYADEGEYVHGQMPDNMMYLLDQYVNLVSQRQDMSEGVEENAGMLCGEWKELLAGTYSIPTKANKIYSTSSWDQGQPNGSDGYNLYCPTVTTNGQTRYCYAGCVAIAMSQIMHYFKYPYQGKLNASTSFNGTSLYVRLADSTFDYSLMPNKLNTSSPTNKKREVAKLIYCAGVCVGMSYGLDGSGAYSNNVPNKMKVNFKYRQGNLRTRSNDQDVAFVDSVRNNLILHFPVYMSGYSSSGEGRDAGGHAWVCDGYQDQNVSNYHMNWGWGGSNNAWFNLRANQMGTAVSGSYVSQYTFNLGQQVILNMTPPLDSLRNDTRFAHLFPESAELAEETNTLSVFPNPASATVSVKYDLQHDADFELYNVEGRKVQSVRVQAGAGTTSVDVESLPAGIYVYRLGAKAGKLVVK